MSIGTTGARIGHCLDKGSVVGIDSVEQFRQVNTGSILIVTGGVTLADILADFLRASSE
jgi:hypothetical protein